MKSTDCPGQGQRGQRAARITVLVDVSQSRTPGNHSWAAVFIEWGFEPGLEFYKQTLANFCLFVWDCSERWHGQAIFKSKILQRARDTVLHSSQTL